MYKLVGLLKRRPGMTRQDFIRYYETTHRRIGEKYLAGHAVRYMRRFLDPLPNPLDGTTSEPEFDVILEIWFSDRARCEATMAMMTAPEIAAEISADEEQLFDRPRNRFFTVEEHVSELPPPRGV